MGLRSWRRRDDVAEESSPLITEEHAWWAERDSLERVFVASTGSGDADENPLSDFWSPESLYTYDRRDGDDVPDELADPHDVLGVSLSASWSEIALAHRRLAKQYHPDVMVGAGPQEQAAADERMRRVNQAYNQLQRQRRAAVS